MATTPDQPADQRASSGLSHTDWSMIYAARGDGEEAPEKAMERLVKRYWPSVYAFVRRSGRDVHEASDLTQGFICDVVLGRRILADADPSRGKFRSLLLQSLKNYMHEKHRYDTRQRRAPKSGKPISLEPGDLARVESSDNATPEAAFAAQWGTTLIESVLDQVRASCMEDSLESHWAVFEARVVQPMLFGGEPVGYEELLDRLGLDSASQAANMMITVKRRFARVLHEEVAATVTEPWQVKEELSALMRDLEGSS